MCSAQRMAKRFLCDDTGATAIEYAMLASLLSMAVVAAIIGVSDGTGGLFDTVFTKVKNAMGGS